jgi:ubiquinone/menaquinone biosynthesis C-methylase UbiE
MENNQADQLVTSKFIDPVNVISQLGIAKGNIIADFGCGSGYFSIPLAQAVGEDGMVHSLDVLPQALETVASKAKVLNLTNVKTKRVNLEREKGSGLEDESMSWVIVKDMLFQNGNKKIILKEAYRVLKPEGKVFVMEWNDKDSTVGPEKNLRVPKEELENIIKENNFKIEKEIEAGDFHYAMVIVK